MIYLLIMLCILIVSFICMLKKAKEEDKFIEDVLKDNKIC